MSKILEGTVPVLATLFLMVALIVYLSHIFSKYMAKSVFKAAKSKHITVIEQVIVGQDRCLLLAKMQERCFLIGVTSHAMSLITELTPEEALQLTNETAETTTSGFKEMFAERFHIRKR